MSTGRVSKNSCCERFHSESTSCSLYLFACISLRRRFEQNQQDISFTIMALLPSLGQHILEGMDVEGITQELQSYSRSNQRGSEHQLSHSSMSSSFELRSDNGHDARSEVSSMSIISGPEEALSSHMAGSSNSWVDQINSGQPSGERSQAQSTSGSESHRSGDSPRMNKGIDLSDSMITSTDSSAISYEDSTKVGSISLMVGNCHNTYL